MVSMHSPSIEVRLCEAGISTVKRSSHVSFRGTRGLNFIHTCFDLICGLGDHAPSNQVLWRMSQDAI